MDLKGSPGPDPLGLFRSPWNTEVSSLSKGHALMEELQAPMGSFYLSFCRLSVSLILLSGSFQWVNGWEGG